MPTIRARGIIAIFVAVDALAILIARFLAQFADGLGLTLVCKDASGLLSTATASLMFWYLTNRLSEKWFSVGKIHYFGTIALSFVFAGFLSTYLVMPITGFPPISSALAPLLLCSGLFFLPVLIIMLILPKVLHRERGVGPTNDTTFYRGRSLLFVKNRRNMAVCILKLVSQSAANSRLSSRNLISHNHRAEDLEATQDRFQEYSYLVSLWNNVPEFSVEFMVENGTISVKYFISAIDSDPERAIRSAEQKAEKLESVLQARFRSNIEFLQGQGLWLAYGSILGGDPYCAHESVGDCVRIRSLGETEDHYVAVSALKRKAEPTLPAGTFQAQVEQFLSAFAKEQLTASMVVRMEAIRPPSLSPESKLVDKARNQPDMRVLLELNEKKSEVNEERQAQLSGFWKISAHVAYRGRTARETRLFQEKGDACIEAIYSSSRSKVSCVKLKGKDIARHVDSLLARQGIGVVMMKASSRIAATLVDLPEERMPGIPRCTVPNFEVPPREELEEGEVIIGIVMSGDNEICPMRIRLDDLMLHTVIFGETGFGKTRLIMKMLEEISSHEVAWTIIEMKGEYRPLVKALENVIYLRPASQIAPLKVCLFDPQMENPETHAKKIFTILKETFSTLFIDQNRDLSAQMERVFYEALVTYVRSVAEGKEKNGMQTKESDSDASGRDGADNFSRGWTGFYAWLKRYGERIGPTSMPQINSTIQALLNRLNSFTRSPLDEVFDNDTSNVNFNDLVKRRAIIDLSEVRTKGTPEDLRLISNIITKYVATAAQQRDVQHELKHILVIDDALDIVPEILAKKTTAETTITEQMVLLLRTNGQGVIVSTQRPNISQNILANAATKIFLRTTVDNEKAAKWLALDEDQANYLKAAPKREAVVMTPRFSKPIRIKTLDMSLPRVDNKDIVMNNMMNYPILYDGEEKIKINTEIKELRDKETEFSRPVYSETARLRDTAGKAYVEGNYKVAMRTCVKAAESIKQQPGAGIGKGRGMLVAKAILQTREALNPQPQRVDTSVATSTIIQQEKTMPTSSRSDQVPRTPQDPNQTTSKHPQTFEDGQLWPKVKRAFNHQQEIVEEPTLRSRLNTQTTQELRTLVEPLIGKNIIGEVKAPNYTNPDKTTTIYYQTIDHEARNILQEYIINTIQKDLQRKGINTRWADQNMELLITNDNQHAITAWTNNSIDPITTIAKLNKIRHELQNEQTKELIIITPWNKDATKLQNLTTQLNIRGIHAIPFTEDQTNKLVNHITIGKINYT